MPPTTGVSSSVRRDEPDDDFFGAWGVVVPLPADGVVGVLPVAGTADDAPDVRLDWLPEREDDERLNGGKRSLFETREGRMGLLT